MPETTYLCSNPSCDESFQRYASMVRTPSRVYCSVKCKSEHQKTLLKGANNPNYKHGKHCEDQQCLCGRPQDYRAMQCSICANRSYPKDGVLDERKSDDILRAATAQNRSFFATSRATGLSRKWVTKRAKELNLDLSHFAPSSTRPLTGQEVLTENSPHGNAIVKRVLLDEGLALYECSACGQGSIWNGGPLTLQLHHIDGNSTNNRKENLEFLCPNCHSQTPTYTGRKPGKSK